MGESLFSVSYYADKYKVDMRKFADTVAEAATGGGAVFLAETDGKVCGMIACVLIETWFIPEQKRAEELFWWVDPDSRGTHHVWKALLKSMENWAIESGCTSYSMSSSIKLPQDRMMRIYGKLGYEPQDILYTKEFRNGIAIRR